MNTDLMTDDEAIQSSTKRTDSFIKSDFKIGELKLRPFTAGSLLILKKVGNHLIMGGQTDNAEFDILSFIYIHTAPLAEVRYKSFDKQRFWEAVLEWADKVKVQELEQAGKIIEEIIVSSGLAIASPIEGKGGGDASPN
ncbi:MAG: hypothetical protein EBT78_08030 [Betaproteobacteria bacterium]|jgi:hypothetical protein|nr:hypothetical protein [Betaproteobacteria bacterium]